MFSSKEQRGKDSEVQREGSALLHIDKGEGLRRSIERTNVSGSTPMVSPRTYMLEEEVSVESR